MLDRQKSYGVRLSMGHAEDSGEHPWGVCSKGVPW